MHRGFFTRMMTSQRWRLTLLGALIAITLFVGLVLVRNLAGDEAPTLAMLRDDLVEECITYLYVAGSTLAVATVLGWLVGSKAEYLEHISLTDPLTQLANRRGFLAVLHDELARAARYHTPLTMMILDLDFLKVINDAGGHEAGDAALRLVADSLRGTCRGTDLAARFGGDEFVVVAPSTTATEAFELANRIRNKLRALSHNHPEIDPLSLSIGIADLACTGAASAQGEALIGAADAALYVAKESGRDRACLAHPPSTAGAAAVA